MIKMRVVFLVLLAITSVNSQWYFQGSWIYQMKNQNSVQCLQNYNLMNPAVISLYLNSGKLHFGQLNLVSIINSKIPVDVQIYGLNSQQLSPDEYAFIIADFVKNITVTRFWINVQRQLVGNRELSCQYLLQFLQSLKKYSGRLMGIRSNRGQWQAKYKDPYYCQQIGDLPLMDTSLLRFEQFGGWKDYQFQFHGGNGLRICDSMIWEITAH